MLTGEYDWSNTPAMSQATCDKIPGGRHQAMEGLGHFPATENPKKFVPHCELPPSFRASWVSLATNEWFCSVDGYRAHSEGEVLRWWMPSNASLYCTNKSQFFHQYLCTVGS